MKQLSRLLLLLPLLLTPFAGVVAQMWEFEQGKLMFGFAEPERLDINTEEYSEILPIVSPDGKRMFFSRREHPENAGGLDDRVDIWYTDWETTGWGEPKHIKTYLNNPSFNFISSISGDGKTIVLGNTYGFDGRMLPGPSYSEQKGVAFWTFPKKLFIRNFDNEDHSYNFNLSRDGKILLMSVEKNGTLGDRDIFVSFKVPYSNEWTTPKNLGKVINTGSLEMTPYLAEDNKTLFFSSNGMGGFGDQDVFISYRQDDTWTNWTTPQNLGEVINTESSDAYFALTPDENNAYFAVGAETPNSDIYTVRFLTKEEREQKEKEAAEMLVSGCVVDRETNENIPGATVAISGGEMEAIDVTVDENGCYQVRLQKGFDYSFNASAENYQPAAYTVSIPVSQDSTMERNLPLDPLSLTITLQNVYFDFGKSTLRPESKEELDRAYEVLSKRPNVDIVVEGHTDNRSSWAFNKRLSEARARRVMEYLINKGIAASRLSSIGYSYDRPVAPNTTDEGRQRNRRVELRLSTRSAE